MDVSPFPVHLTRPQAGSGVRSKAALFEPPCLNPWLTLLERRTRRKSKLQEQADSSPRRCVAHGYRRGPASAR